MSIISAEKCKKMEKTLCVYLSRLLLFVSKLQFCMFVGFVENKVLWQDASDYIHINQQGANMFPGSTLKNKTSFLAPPSWWHSVKILFSDFIAINPFPKWMTIKATFIGHISFLLNHFNHIWYLNVTCLETYTIFWPKCSRKSAVNQK